MKKNIFAATVAALTAQIIFGFSFMFTKMALRYASPLTVIADRYIVAFLGLTAVMLITKTKIKINKNIWKLLLMSLFQPLLYFIFESYGIQMTTSSFSSVMISLIPIVAMISGIFLLKEMPSLLQYIFALMSVVGVALMTYSGNADGTVTPLGVILLLGAVVSSVAYNIASRKISSEFSVLERTYTMSLIGVVAFTSISLIENLGNPTAVVSAFASPTFTIAILYLGVFSSVIAFLCLNYANTYLPVVKTTVFSNITTVVSVVAGVMFLHESFSLYSIISIIMIITGVIGVQVSKKDESR